MKKLNFKKVISLVLAISCFTALIPNVLAQDNEDYTKRYPAVQKLQQGDNGDIYIGRWYNNPNRMSINDAGFYDDGQFFQFKIPQEDLNYLESAKIYIKAIRGGNKPLFIHKYSKGDAPEIPTELGTNNRVDNEADKKAYTDFINGFTSIDYLYSAENVVDYASEVGSNAVEAVKLANWVSFDLMKKDEQGNPYITLVPGDLTVAVHSAKNTNMGDINNTLVLADRTEDDPDLEFNIEAGLAYIELKYNKDSLRIDIAQAAIDLIEPYVQGEITDGNVEDVRSLLDDAALKVADVKTQAKKEEFQAVIDAVRANLAMYEIEGLREEFSVSDDFTKNYDLENPMDLTLEKDYYVGFDISLVDALEETQGISFALGNTVFEIKADGVYLNNEKSEAALEQDNFVVIKMSGQKAFVYLNGEKILSDTVSDDEIDSFVIANNCEEKIDSIENITIETCFDGYGSDIIDKVNELESDYDTLANEGFFELYEDAKDAITSLGTSILAKNIPLQLDFILNKRVDDKIDDAINSDDYEKLLLVKEFIDMYDEPVKTALMDKYNAQESYFDDKTPSIASAQIISDGKLSVEYVIEDTYKNASNEVTIEWYLNGTQKIGVGEEIDIEFEHRGEQVCAKITPKNIKGVNGDTFTTTNFEIPQLSDAELEDKILRTAAVQRFQKINTTGDIFIGRWYNSADVDRFHINEGGWYPDGQIFQFKIPQKDRDYLKSAKIYIKAVRGGGKPLYIHKYSNETAPEIPELATNRYTVKNQEDTDRYTDFINGFTQIEYLYSAENVVDSEDNAQANWVSFDLMKKDDQGNPYITFNEESDDLTVAVGSAKTDLDKDNNTMVLGNNAAGFVNDDPQDVSFNNYGGLAYIELEYDKDPVRIRNAQVAVNKLEPYVEGEINSSNKATVRSLLDAAAAKVALITNETQKSQLQKTIDEVETKYNNFEILDLRRTYVVPVGFDLSEGLDPAFDLTSDKEYYAKFTTELNAPLADAENVTFNLGAVSFGINATGVWLNDESAQLDYGEKPELLIMITKDGENRVATLFVNNQDVLEVEIQETSLDTIAIVDNTTDKINDIEDVVAEICPADYAKEAIESVEAFEASLEATDDQFKNQYTKTATSVSRLGDSLINALLSQRVLNNWATRINNILAEAVEKKDYSIVEEVKDTIAGLSNIALKDALSALCEEPEATFNNLVPEIAYASITGNVDVGKTISVSYTIKDTYKNASDDVVIKWILNDKDEIETGSELVISSKWKGEKIKAVVTPKNNKGTLGKSYTTVSVKVPNGGNGGNGGSAWGDVITDSMLNKEPSTIPPQKLAFSDIANSWAKNDIMALYEKGYIKGISEDKFGPDNSMTRAEFVTLLLRILGIEEESYNNAFEDVKAGDWYANAVGTAFSKGFINGKGNGFKPNDKVTREEAAKIIAVAKNLKSKTKETSFTDNDSISQWAKNYVAVVQETGLITGYPDGSFGPQKNITRAESVIIFLRILDL